MVTVSRHAPGRLKPCQNFHYQHASMVNRVHKMLEYANIKLSAAISDLMRVSGRRILRAIASGQTDTVALAAPGDTRLQAAPQELQASLLGNVTEHYRFMLETLLDQAAFLEQQITRLDQRTEEQMRPFEVQLNHFDTIDGIDQRGA